MGNYGGKGGRKQVLLALREESITILPHFIQADYMRGCLKKKS